VGAERLPAGVSTLRRLRDCRRLSKNWCDENPEEPFMMRIAIAALIIAAAALPASAQTGKTSPGAGPVIVFETEKGAIEIETYPNEAPKTVAQILGLVKRGFYNGQRVHRVEPNFVIQFGDPQTRDMTKEASWGRGSGAGSGKPIGVAEMHKNRPHKLGSVAMAHAGNPAQADSQIYITLRPTPALDKNYTVFGQVISGMDVVKSIRRGDRIKRATVK
jgi:cyclophilin family peptidyl-prolyl cis-trans isomerase